jgi:hypothetical protein
MGRTIEPNSLSGRVRAMPLSVPAKDVAAQIGCTENLVRVVRSNMKHGRTDRPTGALAAPHREMTPHG